MRFLEGLTETRKAELLEQLRAVWTHDSTAIEGNTLSLGDTMFVLSYGLTVRGKPLKDQVDVQNHAHAVDAFLAMVDRGRLTEEDLFYLHRIVINEQSHDIYKPVGAYKREDNGTYHQIDGKSIYHSYLSADEVPHAMRDWILKLNNSCHADLTEAEALAAYIDAHMSFTAIHPFYDGNGRLARLIANLPVLVAGFPPIVVSVEYREAYLQAIWRSERNGETVAFRKLLETSWETTLALVREAHRAHSA